MLLREMFSVLGAPEKSEEDIDWLNDLKLFIDDNNIILTKIMMPAVKMHRKHVDRDDAHKFYIKSLNRCADLYCKKFEIKNQEEIFSPDKIEELAKRFSDQQKAFIEKGDYEDDGAK